MTPKHIFSISLLLTVSILAYSSPIYVKSDASESGDGASWATAFADLQDAIEAADAGDSIFVAKGVYKPTVKVAEVDDYDQPTTDRDKSFILKKDVKIFGGFAGTESDFANRDWKTNVTTLSGDLGDEGDNSDNAYHVVFSIEDVGSARLDGFTITGGNANGIDQINIGDITFDRERGGGICLMRSSPLLTNLIISENIAKIHGGGIRTNYFASPVLINVTISGNTAHEGGGVYYNFSSPTMVNVTISGNTATVHGGAMCNHYTNPILFNCLLVGNSKGEVYNVNSTSISTPLYYNTLVAGMAATSKYALLDGTNVTAEDVFVSPITPGLSTEGDFRLKEGCLAIGAGSTSYWTNKNLKNGSKSVLDLLGYANMNKAKDLAGNKRAVEEIDLGAYEFGDEPIGTECAGVSLESAIMAYPTFAAAGQPVTVVANLDETLLSEAVIKVFDSVGHLQFAVPVEGRTTQLQLPSAAGLYLLRFEAKGIANNLKVVVK